MVEQFPSHLSYLDRSQQRGPHGGHNHCNGQTSSELFVNDILTELKCLDNSIPLFCCTLIPWHNWLKAQYPDTLIGASIPQYPDLIGAKCMSKIPYRCDPFDERYIRYCCDLIGARYLPWCCNLTTARYLPVMLWSGWFEIHTLMLWSG